MSDHNMIQNALMNGVSNNAGNANMGQYFRGSLHGPPRSMEAPPLTFPPSVDINNILDGIPQHASCLPTTSTGDNSFRVESGIHHAGAPSDSNGTHLGHDKPPPPPAPKMYSNTSNSNLSSGPRMSPRPTRESVLKRLSEALLRRSLTVIDMSQRDLQPSDAKLIKIAVMQNTHLHTLKLGYNHLGDEGLITLAPALARSNLQSLDLGFTGVGDMGMEALANSFLQGDVRSTSGLLTKQRQRQILQSNLNTLYLSGNCISTRGCLALAKMIQFGSCKLKKLHLTGNRIGVDGVRSLTRALSSSSSCFSVASSSAERKDNNVVQPTVEELFLGGTGLGSEGCHAVAEMLSNVSTLRVLSLADNDLSDRECYILSDAIRKNRDHLPLEAIQLSFNRISCVGVESLMNAVWGSNSLQEIRLDNNGIGDRGAQLIAVVVSTVPSLTRLDVGFNSLTAVGMRALMKSVADSDQITSLSISGNKLDTDGAKAVAYALAYNRSMKYFFMDNCAANHASQRHITAGIVSNCEVSLQTLTGFRLGAVAVTLGLPSALEQMTNEQVLKFILLMWEQNRYQSQPSSNGEAFNEDVGSSEEGMNGQQDSNNRPKVRKPLDPATVVAVADRAYASLGGDGNLAEAAAKLLQYTPRDSVHSPEPSLDCPVVEDAIMIEADSVSDHDCQTPGLSASVTCYDSTTEEGTNASSSFKNEMEEGLKPERQTINNNNSMANQYNHQCGCRRDVVSGSALPLYPRGHQQQSRNNDDRESLGRKRQNVDWLCHHIKHLHQLSQLPFNSAELWRLHQHYSIVPVKRKHPNPNNHCGDKSHHHPFEHDGSPTNSISGYSTPPVAEVETWQSQGSMMQTSVTSAPCASCGAISMSCCSRTPPFSESALSEADGSSMPDCRPDPNNATIRGNLERKVSFRSLNDALLGGAFPTAPVLKDRGRTISAVIEEDIAAVPSAQPRVKRQRQNRSKMSYFPRIKAKVESFLEKDHHKALVLLRQLHYTEHHFLSAFGRAQENTESAYLRSNWTKDVETILLDMI